MAAATRDRVYPLDGILFGILVVEFRGDLDGAVQLGRRFALFSLGSLRCRIQSIVGRLQNLIPVAVLIRAMSDASDHLLAWSGGC